MVTNAVLIIVWRRKLGGLWGHHSSWHLDQPDWLAAPGSWKKELRSANQRLLRPQRPFSTPASWICTWRVGRVLSRQSAGLQLDEGSWTLCLILRCSEFINSHSWWTVLPRCRTFDLKMRYHHIAAAYTHPVLYNDKSVTLYLVSKYTWSFKH